MTRREFIKGSAATAACAVLGAGCKTQMSPTRSADSELILEGTRAAIEKNLLPALQEKAYPGHFTVTADGGGYGGENTWSGLDGWEMAGAYLLMGKRRAMLDFFDFVQASQRKDGNIPWAIFPGEQSPGSLDSWLRGMNYPADVCSYKPPVRPGQLPQSNMGPRKWIGLFSHWQKQANPLSTLGAASYILIAAEIYADTKSKTWLEEKLPSLEAAGRHLLTRISANGLMDGSGFYIELPPRYRWDGITQCYGAYVFRQLAEMNRTLGRKKERAKWNRRADVLAAKFSELFWRRDHFAEYIHPEHGVVDSHGLSDVNWAAIGLGVATDKQTKILRPILMNETGFWRGGMPTQLVARPGTYEKWELNEPLPFGVGDPMKDAGAMGRVWYLEYLACRRMGEHRRIRESVLQVCALGKKNNWSWSERYHVGKNDTLVPTGVSHYCEYPAILTRIVLGSVDIFPEAKKIRREVV